MWLKWLRFVVSGTGRPFYQYLSNLFSTSGGRLFLLLAASYPDLLTTTGPPIAGPETFNARHLPCTGAKVNNSDGYFEQAIFAALGRRYSRLRERDKKEESERENSEDDVTSDGSQYRERLRHRRVM